MSGDGPGIVTECRDNIGWITLNRPHKANALTIGMQVRIVEFLRAAATDDSVAAIILTGAGTRAFCGGADFSEVTARAPAEQAQIRSRHFFDCCLAFIEFPKPLITAINGHACGSGFMLALLADACVATPDATFSLPEIARGQSTFAGASLLNRLLGDLVARDLVLSGRRMDAAEAMRLSLVSAICPPDELHVRATDIAMRLARNSPRAYRLNKEWIYRDYRALLEEAAKQSAAARPQAP